MSNHYKVVLEIEVDAETPLEAAQKAQVMGLEDPQFIYVVQDDETEEITTVDLSEADYKDSVLPHEDYEPMIERLRP
jgi:hypothetical protein